MLPTEPGHPEERARSVRSTGSNKCGGAWEFLPGLPLSRSDLRGHEGHFHPLLWSARLSLLSEEVTGTGRTQKLTPRLSRPAHRLSLQALPMPTGFRLLSLYPGASHAPTSDTAHNQAQPPEATPSQILLPGIFRRLSGIARLLAHAVQLGWGGVRASGDVSRGQSFGRLNT